MNQLIEHLINKLIYELIEASIIKLQAWSIKHKAPGIKERSLGAKKTALFATRPVWKVCWTGPLWQNGASTKLEPNEHSFHHPEFVWSFGCMKLIFEFVWTCLYNWLLLSISFHGFYISTGVPPSLRYIRSNSAPWDNRPVGLTSNNVPWEPRQWHETHRGSSSPHEANTYKDELEK